MTGFWAFDVFDAYIAGVCPHYKQFPGSWALTALENYPFYLTIGLIAVSLYRNEKYLELVSIYLTLDWLLNYIVKDLIVKQSPPTPGCGDTYEMPSYAAEQASLFSTLMLGFAEIWGVESVGLKPMLISISVLVPCFARTFVGFSSVPQVIIGFQFGLVEGLFYLWITKRFLWPRFNILEKWKLMEYLEFVDTLCGPFMAIEDVSRPLTNSTDPSKKEKKKKKRKHSDDSH